MKYIYLYLLTKFIKSKLKTMKKFTFTAFVLFTFIASAQTFVSTSVENKNIILEEFTGISCGYCPDGHKIGQDLHDANPNDVFLINIHTGGYATPQGPGTDFNTSFGSAIAGQSGLSGYPAGTVNRHQFTMTQGGGTAMSRGDWNSASSQLLSQVSPVNVGIQASIDMATSTLTVDVEVYYTGSQTVSTNMLNIAVVQNGILGPQSGGSTYNPTAIDPATGLYTHNHMLRHMMTGQWGESIMDVTQNTLYSNQFTWTMPTNINGVMLDPTNIDVVAFVAEGHQEILNGTEVSPELIFSNSYDAYLVSTSAEDNICSDISKGIQVELKNYGNLPLQTLDITYEINGGAQITFPWTGYLTPGLGTNVTLPNYTYLPSGTNTLTVTSSNPNGNTDQNSSNDMTSSTFTNHNAGTWPILSGVAIGNATIDVTTDQYANETSWELIDDNGIIIASSGTLTNSSSQPTVNVMLNPGTCYTFNMYDSYGDGIYPPAGFEVKDYAGNIIRSNFNFTTSEDITPFEVSGTNPCSSLSISQSSSPATCTSSNGSATCQATGGTAPYSYVWSNGQLTSTASSLYPGSYNLSVTDNNGCIISDIVGVGMDNSNAPVNTFVSTNVLCNGDQTGSITTTVSGGNPAYTYSWSNGLSTQNISNLSSGQYLCEINDALGCFSYALATITEPSEITTSISSVDPSGSGLSDGSITINVTGGTSPYTYSWSNGATSANLNGLATGTYSVTVTDANGCEMSESVELSGTVSIDNPISNISIYPNPVKNLLNIEGDFQSVEIYDIFGKLVLSTARNTINTTDLADGIYIVNVNTSDVIITKRITVSK